MTLLTLLFLAANHSTFALPSDSTQPPKVADSIYKLAVKPEDYRSDASVMLLDEGVYRVESDGRTSNTTRQVVQILTDAGARRYRERALSWNPERQKLTVNWMRVVKPSGEVISAHPEQIQDSDVPAEMGTPMYTAEKVRRISLSGLEPGTIVDYSFTVDTDPPMMPGDFLIGWSVATTSPVIRSNLVVDFPKSLKPRIGEQNLNFKRKESTANGRTVYTWATANVGKQKIEPFAPDSIVQGVRVTLTPPTTWTAIGEWYAPIARDAYKLSPSVEAKMATVMSAARSRDDSIAALHKWIAQDIRYVSIALGRGGYVPRSAETVVRSGFGDCKDKAMLFVAALNKIGVTAYPVLLNILGAEKKENPSLGMFNHMIAAVKQGNTYQFADLTAPTYALGDLPEPEEGNLAVIVMDKSAEQVSLPVSRASATSVETIITGKLSEDGDFSGTQEERAAGYIEQAMRTMFTSPPDSARKLMIGRAVAGQYFGRSEIDSVQVFDGKDFKSRAVVRTWIKKARIISRAGDVTLMTNPIRPPQYAGMADALEREKERTLPFDTSELIPAYRSRIDIRIKLPEGWSATLPPDLRVDGAVGLYETRYSQVGDELHIERTLTGKHEIVPAARQKEIVDWLRRASNEDSRMLVLKAPRHSVASR